MTSIGAIQTPSSEIDASFVGWHVKYPEAFFQHNGPFWFREEPGSGIRCAFRVADKHLNGAKTVHGGCLMSFADYCLFAIASPVLNGAGITVNFSSDFLGIARKDDIIVGTGAVTHSGRSLIFVRGQLTVDKRLIFTFSGTIKHVQRKQE